MQNAGPLSSCSQESWTRKNPFKSQEKPWTSDGFYSSSKMLEFDQGFKATDYEESENLQENVAWPAAYGSIGGESFSEGFSVKAAESEVSEMEMARLLNTRNAEEFSFQAPAASLCGQVQSVSGSVQSGYSLKMEEISASAKPNLISFSASAEDVVKDSAAVAVASGDEISQSFTGGIDKCEESAATDYKRTSSALEESEQGVPSKKNRTAEPPSKLKVQVRKEKLGERITALQQLVSPFGKTDTASVLLEAIGYIKFLQDQVQVLSTPYIKGFPSNQTQDGRTGDSLRGRGLCLMPISCTQLMTNDNGADYWASGIGGGGTRF